MWIRAKYVEKKFLKKMAIAEALVNSERKSERRWAAKKCRRHNSATTVPKHRRKYRQDPGSGSLCSGTAFHLSVIYISLTYRQNHSLHPCSFFSTSHQCFGEKIQTRLALLS